jgi:hypothetical protein
VAVLPGLPDHSKTLNTVESFILVVDLNILSRALSPTLAAGEKPDSQYGKGVPHERPTTSLEIHDLPG